MFCTLGRYPLPVVGLVSFIAILLAYTLSEGKPLDYPSNLANLLFEPSPHRYEIQIFSRDPLILYIKEFLSRREIQHVLKKSEGLYKRTPVYWGEEAYFDNDIRVSETAVLELDQTLRIIRQRARKLQGWRGKSHSIEPLKVQRYGVNGFFNFHWDWDTQVEEGNRVATFMIFLEADCTGGGTNFPDLPMPKDSRWCDVIECSPSEDQDSYQGVTFKPIQGSAIFWENTHVNGSLNTLVRHAGLPVASGQKTGLNIWTWDSAWRPPANGPKSAP